MIHEEHLNIAKACPLFELKQIYNASKKIYGTPKIHHLFLQKGTTVGVKLVQNLMREEGMKSIVNKKFRPSQGKSEPFSRENLVSTEPSRMNQVWSTDITYIHTQAQGWGCLSTIMDRHSKKIIAWNVRRLN